MSLTESDWDAVVVGAGPAGALSAFLLARAGLKALLVEKQAMPRAKACGCCLNGATLAGLRACGLGELPARLHARPLQRVRLGARGRTAELALVEGAALSRERFDRAVADEACRAGAVLRDRCAAEDAGRTPDDHRRIILRLDEGESVAAAKVVIVADGLGGRFLRQDQRYATAIRPNSRVGAFARTYDDRYDSGAIHMACGRGGYVGLVRIEDQSLNVAAALDPALIRDMRGVGPAASAILRSAGFPMPAGFAQAIWRGTPPLTQSRKTVAGRRLFVLGDAAGYVEPFTGEGIAWATHSAIALAPIAIDAAQHWRDELASRWSLTRRRLLRGPQLSCQVIAAGLRSPWLTSLALRALAIAPQLANGVMGRINAQGAMRS